MVLCAWCFRAVCILWFWLPVHDISIHTSADDVNPSVIVNCKSWCKWSKCKFFKGFFSLQDLMQVAKPLTVGLVKEKNRLKNQLFFASCKTRCKFENPIVISSWNWYNLDASITTKDSATVGTDMSSVVMLIRRVCKLANPLFLQILREATNSINPGRSPFLSLVTIHRATSGSAWHRQDRFWIFLIAPGFVVLFLQRILQKCHMRIRH